MFMSLKYSARVLSIGSTDCDETQFTGSYSMSICLILFPKLLSPFGRAQHSALILARIQRYKILPLLPSRAPETS